jgi:hypothetical protein
MPSIRSTLPAALLLSITGWGGLFFLILYLKPDLIPRWLFFFLTVFAITGTFLPGVAFINRRFPSQPAPTYSVILREAILVAIYISTLIWLQLGRVLTLSLVLLLAFGLVLVEILIRLREKARWQP